MPPLPAQYAPPPPPPPPQNDTNDGEEDVCAICLCALSEQPNVQLSCSHRWHIQCLVQQVTHARPNPARRLVFNGIRCAICSRVASHPAVDALVKPTADLQQQVDKLITEQAGADSLHTHDAVLDPSSPFFNDVVAYGRTFYAFYLCSVCKQPYFGGTVACQDVEEKDLPPDDRLCDKCTPRPMAVCSDVAHRAHQVWKCRFCCNFARYLCRANTHMCTTCHAHDPGHIPVQPCCGREAGCRLPMHAGQLFHTNGAETAAEQLLACAWCESQPVGSRQLEEVATSPNMLFNPSGEHALAGWHRSPRSSYASAAAWSVEHGAGILLERQDGPNFVSSHSWARMAQVVHLARFVEHPEHALVEVSARFLSRSDCPSVFRLTAVALTDTGSVLDSFDSGVRETPLEFWETVRHTFVGVQGMAYVVIAVHGKDSRFWAGQYGAKVKQCSVRLLYAEGHGEQEAGVREGAFSAVSEATCGPSRFSDAVWGDAGSSLAPWERASARELEARVRALRGEWRGLDEGPADGPVRNGAERDIRGLARSVESFTRRVRRPGRGTTRSRRGSRRSRNRDLDGSR